MRSRKMSIRKRRPGFGKKRVVKRKSITKKTVPKTVKTMAKKHGIKLTLKRGNKRVPKSEALLRKQIKNKMKSRKIKKTVTKSRKSRKSRFGKLEVPMGMRTVSEMRDQARFLGREHRPLLIAPHGPPQPWLLKDETPAYSGAPAFGRRRRSSRFGSNSLAGKRVNPSGYLSTWNGFPRTAPPSWNYNLLQGGNNFREGINDPTLSNVGTGYGRYRRTNKRQSSKKRR